MVEERSIWHVSVPEYIEEVLMSQKRRAKYWSAVDLLSKKLPKKFIEDGGERLKREYKIQGEFIVDSKGEKIVRNTKTAGKPRYEKVNFQKIYNGSIATFARAKLVDGLHDYYSKVFRDAINRGDLPNEIVLEEGQCLVIYYEFNNVLDSDSSDIDNHCHLHIKTTLDILTKKDNPNQKNEHKLGVIVNDTREFVKGIYYDITEVPRKEDRSLEIHIAVVDKNFKLRDRIEEIEFDS